MKAIDQPKTIVDPVITEVRRHKQEIAAEFGFDVMALGRSLQQRESGDLRFKPPEREGSASPLANESLHSGSRGASLETP